MSVIQTIFLFRLDSAALFWSCATMAAGDPYISFGARLAQLRRENGSSQAELAQRVGLSRASIANIETGKQRVYLHQIYDFARALGVSSVLDLMTDAESAGRSAAPVSTSGAKDLSRFEERIINEVFSSYIKGRDA